MTINRLTTLTLLLFAASLLTAATGVATTDSLSRRLAALTGEEKLHAYEALVLEQEWAEDIQPALDLCDEWIAEAARQGNLQQEETARNRKLTVIYNSEDWEALVLEAAIQRSWLEQHELWDSYYKSWRDVIEGYSYSKQPQMALREAEKMKEHAQQHGNQLGMALAYQQMGVIYDNIDHVQAVRAFERSIELLKEIPGTEGDELLSAYFYMAQELDQCGDFGYELRVCAEWKRLLDQASKTDGSQSRTDVHYVECGLWTASALIGLNRLDEAERELASCERLNTGIKDPYLAYQVYVHRAHLALCRGDLAKAEAMSDLFVKTMETDRWPLAQRLRGEILMKAGRYRDAALLYRHIYEQRDSTFSKEVRMQLDEFNTMFQLDELRMKSQLDRSRFAVGLVVLIVLALVVFIYFRHRAAKRLEQKNRELTIANERAEESSRMKTNFIRQISHEIRTPLNILSGFTQIVTSSGAELDEATRSEIRQNICENTDRITELVNKMLELSDASSQSVIERTDDVLAVQIAAQAAEESRISDAKHVKFDLQIGEGADALQLHTNLQQATRALTLLLDNAQKFTTEGTVTLAVDATAQTDERLAAFTVEDTGIGVPAEEAERIFDEFVQLDEYYNGTGIGLAVARSLARRLGGDVWLDTSYTGGARFVMTLPKT